MTLGSKVWFLEDSLPFEVMAANERFAVCTRKLNKRIDADLLHFEVERGGYLTFMEAYNDLKDSPVYTIIDFEKNIRGTENLVFCMGFGTKELCEEALSRLTKSESEISHRTKIELNIKELK
jgi:hypothetical protein